MATFVLRPEKQVPRINSLGKAKSPCQNCCKFSLSCDRARPRCSTCMERDVLCGGYKLDLNWQLGIASRGKLAGFTYPTTRTASTLGSGNLSSSTEKGLGKKRNRNNSQFRFIAGKPVQKRKPRAAETVNQIGPFPPVAHVPNSSGYRTPVVPSPLSLIQDRKLEETEQPVSRSSLTLPMHDYDAPWFGSNKDFSASTEDDQSPSRVILNFVSSDEEHQTDNSDALLSPSNTARSVQSDRFHQRLELASGFSTAIPPGILFSSLDETFQEILSRYDQDICAIPLTADCYLNPFRIRQETSHGSRHLLHAILATSFYHLERDRGDSGNSALMNEHKAESLHLYSMALSDPSYKYRGLAFLDTALLLMCLDSTQSAAGLYHIHLRGVRSILEAAGGEDLIVSNRPKLRAQLAMFIWYDTTIALISREPMILSVSYLESILSHGRSDGWDYVDLTGCREEFVIIMVKIAKLVTQHQMAERNEWLSFDMTPVEEVEGVLRDFVIIPPSYDSNVSEEELNMALDRYHCDEAWRNGLILYITRVFRWQSRDDDGPSYVGFLARNIINHARSIRKEVTYQKQILIPMFLAGAEARNEEEMDFLRKYCGWWSRSCGFKQFDDVRRYLEEIWREKGLLDMENIWWGTVIERARARAESPLRPEILLG